MMLKMISQNRKLYLNEAFKDAATDFQTTQLWPVHVSEVISGKESIHHPENSFFHNAMLVDLLMNVLGCHRIEFVKVWEFRSCSY